MLPPLQDKQFAVCLRIAPPQVFGTSEAALEAVRGNAGAIAYVAEGTDLGTGVKPLVVEE